MNDMQHGHVLAEYKLTGIPLYDDNPLIEALPPLLSNTEIFARLSRELAHDASHRAGPRDLRIHLLPTLKHFFKPLPRHLELVHNLQLMVRSGYITRNPFPTASTPHTMALETAALTGASGTGKSSSINEALNLMPQVIHHHTYKERDFNRTQVVWMKLECPHDGSPRAVCSSFLKKLDELLGTDYEEKYGGSRSTVGHMIPAMSKLSRQHFVGLIVIDELQNLKVQQHGDKLLKFLVEITNEVSVPILMVGTYGALNLFQDAFRMARRSTGMLAPHWERMKESEEWESFMEALWRYQYLSTPVALDDEIRKEFYQQTMGIADLAVKLYLLVQMDSLIHGDETITCEKIRLVAKVAFQENKRYLDHLRAGRTDESFMSDLVPPPGYLLNEAVNLVEKVEQERKKQEKQAKEKKVKLASTKRSSATSSAKLEQDMFHDPENPISK